MDASDLAKQLLADNVATYESGLRVGLAASNGRLAAIHRAYDLALADTEFKCPTYLMAAIEASRGTYSPFAERRSQPRPDHDFDVAGRPLKAGS